MKLFYLSIELLQDKLRLKTGKWNYNIRVSGILAYLSDKLYLHKNTICLMQHPIFQPDWRTCLVINEKIPLAYTVGKVDLIGRQIWIVRYCLILKLFCAPPG